MAIFGKKEEEKKNNAPTKKDGNLPAGKAGKPAKKKKVDAPIKEKRAKKPSSDAGAKLTKAPGRIIISPLITEKAVQMTIQNAYVFEVAMDATKNDVKNAIRALYKVNPIKVNTVRKAPRTFVARFRNRRGMKKGLKKAYVFLKKGEKIDLA